MTAAYAVFGNRGQYIQPYGLVEVRDAQGHIIWRAKPEQRIVMSPASAAIMTNMLAGVIQRGTGRSARVLPGSVAGKTGTTDNCRDAWFAGYSPQIAAGVWVGKDDGTALGPRETGSRAALPIWIGFMQAALQVQASAYSAYFDSPDSVTKRSIDPRSGQQTDSGSAKAVRVLVRRPAAP